MSTQIEWISFIAEQNMPGKGQKSQTLGRKIPNCHNLKGVDVQWILARAQSCTESSCIGIAPQVDSYFCGICSLMRDLGCF